MAINMIDFKRIFRPIVCVELMVYAFIYYFFVCSSAYAQVLIVIPGQTATCPPATNSQVRAASVKSRRTLPKFWEYYKTTWTTSGRFQVLLLFSRKNGKATALWSTVDSVSGSSFSGKLLNSDNVDRSLRKGDAVTFAKNDPIDWGVKSISSDRWYGRYVQREALPQCDEKNRNIMMSVFLTPSPAW
jgi:uncharacterized protein YegJ (DUF2314 family)